MVDEQAAVVRRQGGVVAEDDAFADQGGRQLEQDAVESDGGVAVDLAGGFVTERLRQVDGGIERHDEMALGEPDLQRGGALQAAMRRAVILAFQPGVEALVEIGDGGQLVGLQRGQELLADGAEESFDFAAASRFAHPRMGDDQAQSIEDAAGLVADKGCSVVAIQATDAAMSGQDVMDAGLEGDCGLAESPAGVDHPAGGVVEEGEQQGDAAAAVGVGQAWSVHEVGLNTLQRGEELELQVLLAVRLPLAGRALQAGRAHQPGQRGAGGGAGDPTVGLQGAQRGAGGQLGVGLQIIEQPGSFGVGQGA